MPAFLLDGKFFARFRDDDAVLALRLGSIAERDVLMRLAPQAFFVTDHYRDHPAVLIRLAAIPAGLLSEVLSESWRVLAERRPPRRPLWTCPACGRRFANRNQSHACGRHRLAEHFRGVPRAVRDVYTAVVAAVRECGPVKVLPEKTRIAFQVRMSFAQVTPRRRWLDGHVVLARRLESPRFRKIETISPRNHVHHFRLSAPAEVDAEFRAWLAEAYAVGEQRHLRRASGRR